MRDSIDSQATNSANALQADHPASPVQPARTAHAIVSAAAPQFVSHPLTRHYPRSVAAPRAGELHLWRFRCEWLPVPVQEGEAWISKGERERARLHPNSALRKRFISARVVTRWIVANLFDCEPHAVDLQDDGNEKLRARHPHDGRGITIDIAYAGIWIVIGIASATLGLSVVVPSPGAALDEAPEASRRRARYGSLCNALRYAPVDVDLDLLSSNTAVLCVRSCRTWPLACARSADVGQDSRGGCTRPAGHAGACRWMAEGVGVWRSETFSAANVFVDHATHAA